MAEVSTATVSNVITGKKYVTPEVRERVFSCMKKLGYSPNIAARALKANKTYNIGVIVPDITNPFFGEILKSIQAELSRTDYQMIVCDTDQKVEKERRMLTGFLTARQVDAVILIAPRLPVESFPQNINMPIVIVDRPPFMNNSKLSFVYSDNRTSSAMIASYAFNAGYRKFACIAGPENVPNANLRLEGFTDQLSVYGIKKDQIVIKRIEFTFEQGFDAMVQILAERKSDERIAVFVCSDIAAWGALEAIKTGGVRINESIGLIGYDDSFFSRLLELSTYQTPTEQMGSIAGTIILKKLENTSYDEPETKVSGQLKIRKTI
ncbi:MAG: LacI family transcriptional regulator [Treponema sp.]|nr:LacI family transcriptional regulator [Treponema sp.]